MNRRCLISSVLAVVFLLGIFESLAWARPNIILVMADDMGYEALRCNGGDSFNSTLLDKLATQGMRFKHCYSQPICTPSRNKIMTGRSNARNYQAFSYLDPNEITFGNVMKAAGYKTCIAGKWQLSGGKKQDGTTPSRCGFDESCMWAYTHNLPKGVSHTGGWEKPGKTSRFWHPSILQNGKYRPTTSDDYGPDIFTQFILDFIEQKKDEPFFVYYPMTLTHGPFLPTPHSSDVKTADKFQTDTKYFSDMVAYTGHCVKRIVDKIDNLGIAENTLVIFTTDNGSHHTIVSSMGDRIFPGGKGTPVDAGCHVPMIAFWEGKIKPGTVCSNMVDFSDFLPTIAELGEAKLPADREIDGRSFLPQLLGKRGNPRKSIFVHYDKDPKRDPPRMRRVRFAYDGQYKLYQDGRVYDVPNDIEEEHALDKETFSNAAKAKLSELQQALDAMPEWRPDNSSFQGGPDNATKIRLNKLKQLRAG